MATPDVPVLRDLTRALLRDNPDLPTQLASAVREHSPRYRDPELITEETLSRACATYVAFICGDDIFDRGYDDAITVLGGERARSGMPLADLLDALRYGFGFLWDSLVEHTRSLGSTTDAELVQMSAEAWQLTDRFTELLQRGYSAELAQARMTLEHERFSLVGTLLASANSESATLWQAADRLGLPREGGFVVVAIQGARAGELPLPGIDAVLTQNHIVSAWVLLSDVQVGIVGMNVEHAMAVLRSHLEAKRATAGISPRFHDYGRTAQAGRLARIALAATRPFSTTVFADSPVGMAAAGAPDVAAEVIDEVLGALMALPALESDLLLGALDAWFEADGSVDLAASALFVHPNTVRNRLRRLESLTGRVLANPREASEVYLALTSWRKRPTDGS